MNEKTKDELVILFRDIVMEENLDIEDALLALIQILVGDGEEDHKMLSALNKIKRIRN